MVLFLLGEAFSQTEARLYLQDVRANLTQADLQKRLNQDGTNKTNRDGII